LSPRRKRVTALGAMVSSMSALFLATGHHPFWATLVWVAVEVAVLVYMIRELAAMKRETSCVKLRLDE